MDLSPQDPERGMKVTMMLADAAQVAEGKLNVLGAGWSVTGPMPAQFAIAMIIEVPWTETNRQHRLRLECIDLDGDPVEVMGLNGPEAIFAEGVFEVGRPPGLRIGTAITQPFAINMPPVPFPPGGHFEWRLTINDTAHDDWRLAFSTRPEAQSYAA